MLVNKLWKNTSHTIPDLTYSASLLNLQTVQNTKKSLYYKDLVTHSLKKNNTLEKIKNFWQNRGVHL